MFKKSSISGITLEPARLVALADLPTVAVRTALMGTASWLDILVLAPGMHRRQSADEVNRGKFPKTGSLVNGSVFRVENPATVSYLQRIGHTGYLVGAVVERKQNSENSKNPYFDLSPPQYHTFYTAGVSVALLYLLYPILTIIVFALVGSIKDWWALAVLGMLVLSRTINVYVIKRRASDSSVWKGEEQPQTETESVLEKCYQNVANKYLAPNTSEINSSEFASNEWRYRAIKIFDGGAEARLKVESYSEHDFASKTMCAYDVAVTLYKCLETIGRGAYESFCKGTHIPNRNGVALKTVNLKTGDDDIGDIQHEVVLLSQLRKCPQHYQVFWLLDGQH